FLYLARHRDPSEAERIKALGIPGVYLLREYRRYYPAGEVAGHILGFTNLDDRGQEGLELGLEQLLRGEEGKAAMQDYRAKAGSVIVIDIDTGEVLAMVNQPSYNPNDRDQLKAAQYRNRAATDIFEPGSSIKPFIMAAALASGQYRPDSVVDTAPGFIQVGNKVFEDEHDLGAIDLATILAKSSNVGTAKVALSLKPEQIWSTLTGLGFGQVTGSGFPGESAG